MTWLAWLDLPFAALLAQEAAADSGKTLLDHIISGGVIGGVIILLSFIALLLVIADLVQIRESRLAPEDIAQRLNEFFRVGDVKGAIQFCQAPDNDCFFTRVVGAALVRCARSPFGFLELKSALEESGREQVERLYRKTDALGLISDIAPMLGLLGTVVGMVGAFDVISQTEGFARPDQLAGNISVALITTVLGLLVAIPAKAAYTWMRNRIDATVSSVGELIEDLAWRIESGADRQGARPAAGPAPVPASRFAAASQRPPAPTVPAAPAPGAPRP